MKQLTKYLHSLLASTLVVVCVVSIFLVAMRAFAQDTPPPADFDVIKAIADLSNPAVAKGLAIAAIVIQGALFLIGKFLPSLGGKWRLAILWVLSAAAAVITTHMAGAPLLAALTAAPVLAALQNAAHQIIVQIKA